MTTTNTLKTVALLGLLSALLIVGGQLLAGRSGMYFGLAVAVVMNFGSYFFSEKIALSTYNAQPVTPTENAEVYRRVQPLVANLCQRMGLPMPKLWLIPDESPNAFATGRNPSHSSVAFTVGITRIYAYAAALLLLALLVATALPEIPLRTSNKSEPTQATQPTQSPPFDV